MEPHWGSGFLRGEDTASRRQTRIANGAKQGFEIVNGSFSLAGPKYFERFRSLCVDVVQKYGANQFKFDGVGDEDGSAGNPTGSGEGTIRDFEAMLRLDSELRAKKPGIYINQTTGTWPSPFWLDIADSIWRGGEDHAFAGVGSCRQRWITYRDGDAYERVVLRPNALSAQFTHAPRHDLRETAEQPEAPIRREISNPRSASFFGTGTQLQEMYITPALLESGQLGFPGRVGPVVAR